MNKDKVKVLTISKRKTPEWTYLSIVERNGKYGVEFEGEFFPLDPKKVFFWSRYQPWIILSKEYSPDIVHSLSLERYRDSLRIRASKEEMNDR